MTTLETPPTDTRPPRSSDPARADKTAAKTVSIFDPAIVRGTLGSSLRKLDPRNVARNPVMFVVEIGSAITSVIAVSETFRNAGDIGFVWAITVWLWFTVLFANFAEAMAEGRGKPRPARCVAPAPRRWHRSNATAASSRSPPRCCVRAISSSAGRATSSPPTVR
jgi:high-affinity K+ transport system ATPase subunit B